MDNRLNELVESYYLNKTELDSYKKLCDNQNKSIKDLMLEMNVEDYDSDNYHASRKVSTRENFNEEQLLEFIRSTIWADKGSMHCPYIKTKYVVDYDALEKAIYNGDITKEQLLEMEKCKTVTEVVTLRVTKRKKETENE